MTTLSTHVLDTATGEPAVGLDVRLDKANADGWEDIAFGSTDEDGRAAGFGDLEPGTYRLAFATGPYGNEFYPVVHVVFVVEVSRDHYHVPLLLSPYGYTTYRGS